MLTPVGAPAPTRLDIHRSGALDDLGRPAGVWKDPTETIVGRAFVGACRLALWWASLGTFVFAADSLVVDGFPEASVSDAEFRRGFLRDVLPIILQARGYLALHASAAIVDGRLLICCGQSHQGKSTLAYGLQRRGLPQFSDDQIVIGGTDGHWLAYPLPFSPNLRAPSVEVFGQRDIRQAPRDEVAPVPVGTIVTLAQHPRGSVERPVALTRLAGAHALTSLLPHAHCFDPGNISTTSVLTEDYLALLRDVPLYRLDYEADFAHFDRLLDDVIAVATPG